MASTLPRRCFFETWKSISLCGACLAAVIPAAGPAVAGGIHKNQGDARDPEHAPLGSFASRTHHPGDARARTPGTAKQPGELQCNGYFGGLPSGVVVVFSSSLLAFGVFLNCSK